jgi:hypothetical protein
MLETPIDKDLAAALRRITDRYIRLRQGTPAFELKTKLDKKRHLLSEAANEKYIRNLGEQYFPCFRALELEDEATRDFGERSTTLILKALKAIYKREGDGRYGFDKVFEMCQKLDIGVVPEVVRTGMLFALDFPRYVITWSGWPHDDSLNLEATDRLLDFEDLKSAWKEELKDRDRQANQLKLAAISGRQVHSGPSQDSPMAMPPNFSFVGDSKLRHILERDYQELQLLGQLPTPKSRLVLTGALIEGFLLDALERNDVSATASFSALKGKSKPIDEWTLDEMIEIALALNLISQGAARLSTASRHFRNLVHLNEERRKDYVIGVEEATGAEAALKTVIRDLRDRNKKNP